MLLIREAQMEVLSGMARQQFLGRLERHLQEVVGELPNGSAIDAVGIMKSAQSLGITLERDIARFGVLMYRCVRTHEPAVLPRKAQNILLAHGVAPEIKLDRLAAWAADGPQAGVANG